MFKIKTLSLRWGAVLAAFCLFICSSISTSYAQDNELPVTTKLGAPISSQAVYENPDDHALNLRYAFQQIKNGEMLNAGAALERMLYANPDWHSARLLYAAVLYRLDDQKAALRELSLLEGKVLDKQQKETLVRYKEQFAKPPEAVFQNGQQSNFSSGFASNDPVRLNLGFGFRVDDNAGNALVDSAIALSERADVSAVLDAGLTFTKPLNGSKTTSFQAGIRGHFRRHETFSNADFDVIDLKAGISTKPKTSRLSGFIDARRINISGENYLEQIGPRAVINKPISKTAQVTFSVAVYAQDYHTVLTAPLEDKRDGVKTNFQAGILKKIGARNRLSVSVGVETKSADLRAFAYDGRVINASFEHKMDNEMYLKSEGRFRNLKFKDSLNPAVLERSDDRLYLRQSIGIPLTSLVKSKGVKAAIVEFGVNYIDRSSDDVRKNYENVGADIKLKIGL